MHTTRRPSAHAAQPGAEPRNREGFAAHHQQHATALALWAELQIGPALRQTLSPEDLTQEIWARAYAAFAGFDPDRGEFRPWLFGIAYNVLREALRNLRVQPRPGVEFAGLVDREPADHATSLATALDRRDRHGALGSALANLNEEERRLVAWRGLEDLPYAEVGERLGLGASAVESRWRRLLERLRKTLPRPVWADWLGERPDAR